MDNIKNTYIDNFFDKLTKEDKDSIYFNDFMWHAFSSEKVSAIEGINAIQEFKKNERSSVYIFFQNKDIILERENLTYNDLLSIIKEDVWNNMDCYVVAKDFQWTFVCTHETCIPNEFDMEVDEERDFEDFPSIGPFFARRI